MTKEKTNSRINRVSDISLPVLYENSISSRTLRYCCRFRRHFSNFAALIWGAKLAAWKPPGFSASVARRTKSSALATATVPSALARITRACARTVTITAGLVESRATTRRRIKVSQVSRFHFRRRETLNFATLKLLNHHCFLVLAKHFAQRIRDLADGGIGLHRGNDVRHQVIAGARGGFHPA